MTAVLQSPFFGVALTIAAYEVGVWVNKKCHGNPMANPLLIALCLILPVLVVFQIPVEHYDAGGDVIGLMLVPVTAVLGMNIYRQRLVLKEKFVPIVFGCLAGCLFNAAFVTVGCHLLGVDTVVETSLIVRSVTSPIAIALSEQLGGVPVISVAAVLISGVTGAALAPLFVKLFRVESPVAAGVAIGASSHALGTATALQLGEVQGAMSGISIGVSGILTVILCIFL